jgi:hypothetical protein
MKRSYVISIYRAERLAVLHCDIESDLPHLSYPESQFIQRYFISAYDYMYCTE